MQITKKFSTLLGYGALTLAGGLMLASALTTDAQARGGHGGMMERPSFEELDADGSGEITEAEMKARGAARFASMDANGDGKLTVEEIVAAHSGRAADRAERMVERFDTNDDGAVSEDELQAGREARAEKRHAKRFARIDRDGSGGLSPAEFEAMMDRRGDHGSRDDN
jgi:Ca2+-binding EF-hand superfamily protein